MLDGSLIFRVFGIERPCGDTNNVHRKKHSRSTQYQNPTQPYPPPHTSLPLPYLIIKLVVGWGISRISGLEEYPCNNQLQKITSDEFDLIESFYFEIYIAFIIVFIILFYFICFWSSISTLCKCYTDLKVEIT